MPPTRTGASTPHDHGTRKPARRLVATALCCLALTACSATGPADDVTSEPVVGTSRADAPSPAASSSAEPAASARPTAPLAPPASPTPAVPADLVAQSPSMADHFDDVPEASRLRLGRLREQTEAYRSWDVTWRSDGLRISGVLDVPTGAGPFPAVVLAHGWIDRDAYVQGQGMTRERAWFAERGRVALHVDYRSHAASDDDPDLVRELYLGYARDVLGAVAALRASDLPVVDDHVSLMGRSMGGSVVLQALEMAPGFVSAGVVYSGQSSLEAENYRRWGGPGQEYAADFVAEHGTPAEDAVAWRAMSTRPWFARITEPVLMVHGRSDEQCPPRWARATATALDQAGVDTRLRWYDDAHAFGPRFTDSMRDVSAFLDRA